MSFWQRITGAVILLIVLLYVGDYLFVRFRMANPGIGSAFGSFQMRRLYAIPLKNGKIEYEFDALQPTVTMPCVHALFPHMGNQPCWYLKRKSQKPFPWL